MHTEPCCSHWAMVLARFTRRQPSLQQATAQISGMISLKGGSVPKDSLTGEEVGGLDEASLGFSLLFIWKKTREIDLRSAFFIYLFSFGRVEIIRILLPWSPRHLHLPRVRGGHYWF